MSAQVLFCMTALQPTHAIRRGQGLQTEPPGNRFEVPPVDRHDHLRVSVHTVPSNEVRHAARHAGRLEVFRARQNRLAFERHRCEQPVLPRQRRRQQNSRRIEITAKGPRARREPSVRADRLYIAGTIRRAWWHIVSVGLRKPIERGAEADRVTVGLFMSLCKGCIWVNWSWDRAALGELVLGPVECRGLRIGRHDALHYLLQQVSHECVFTFSRIASEVDRRTERAPFGQAAPPQRRRAYAQADPIPKGAIELKTDPRRPIHSLLAEASTPSRSDAASSPTCCSCSRDSSSSARATISEPRRPAAGQDREVDDPIVQFVRKSPVGKKFEGYAAWV